MKSIFPLSFVALLSWNLALEVLAHPANPETSPAGDCLTSFTKQFRSQVSAEQAVITDAGVGPSNGFTGTTNTILYPHDEGYRGVNFDAEPFVLTKPILSAISGGKLIHPNGDKSKCLGAVDDSIGSPVELFDCPIGDGTPPANILWRIGDDAFMLFDDKCLDDTSGVTTDGQKMQIWTCVKGHKNQNWHARDDGSIELDEKKKCLDNTEGRRVVGNPAQIWSCTGGPNQKWTISDPGQDYEISLTEGGLCLTAGGDQDGAGVTLELCDRSFGQAWNPEGGVLRVYGDKCLEVHGSPGPTSPLQISTCVDGNADQMWTSPTLQLGYDNSEGYIRWTNTDYCAVAWVREAGYKITTYKCTPQNEIWTYRPI